MTDKTDKFGGAAALAGAAIGSAALAAALLYTSRRKERAKEANQPPRTSTAPKITPPETD